MERDHVLPTFVGSKRHTNHQSRNAGRRSGGGKGQLFLLFRTRRDKKRMYDCIKGRRMKSLRLLGVLGESEDLTTTGSTPTLETERFARGDRRGGKRGHFPWEKGPLASL